jgi:hypothetical protein
MCAGAHFIWLFDAQQLISGNVRIEGGPANLARNFYYVCRFLSGLVRKRTRQFGGLAYFLWDAHYVCRSQLWLVRSRLWLVSKAPAVRGRVKIYLLGCLG